MRDGTWVYSSTTPLAGNGCMALIDVDESLAANALRTEGLPPLTGEDVSPSSPRPRPLLRERNHCITFCALLVLACSPCPTESGARDTLSLSDADAGSAERDCRSDGSRKGSFSRAGVSGSRVELRPERTLIERAMGSTMTLSVLRRLFFPLSGLRSDVCVAEASIVGLTEGEDEGATCNVDGRREVEPDIFEMVEYSEFAAELSDGTRVACDGKFVASDEEGVPKILPRPILSIDMPLLCLPLLDEPEPVTLAET